MNRRRSFSHRTSSRLYRLVSAVVALALLANGIAPVFFGAGSVQAATADNYLSQRGQVTLPGPMGTAVNLFSGNLYKGLELFNFEALLPLRFELSYNSLLRERVGLTGYHGWRHNYEIEYQEQADGSVVILWGNGRFDRYLPAGGGVYNPAAGVSGLLYRRTATTYELTLDDQTVYYFDSIRHPRVTRIQHPSGQALIFNYDHNGLLTGIGHSFGYFIELQYVYSNETSLLNRVIDETPGSGPRSYFLGESDSGNLGNILNPAGETTFFLYDSDHKLTSIEGPPGGKVNIFYGDDRVGSMHGPGISRSFSSFINRTEFEIQWVSATVTDRVGGNTYRNSYEIDGRGRLQERTDPFQNKVIIDWDDKDNPVRIEDEKGHVTQATFDEQGHILTLTDPLNRTTSYTYDPVFGYVTSITDPENNVTTFTYDDRGNMEEMLLPSGGLYEYTYDPNGLLASETDPNGATVEYDYDSFGHLSNMLDPLNETTIYEYDPRGNLMRTVNPSGVESLMAWDALDRLLTAGDGINPPTQHIYDDDGNLQYRIDPNGHTYTYGYSDAGWLETVDDPMGRRTSYEYDDRGDLIAYTNAAGETWTYGYDALGREASETDPLGRTTSFGYDAAGNLGAIKGPDNLITYYQFDAANQVTGINFPDGNDETYLYDDNGNVISASNDDVTVEYTYNELDLPTEVDVSTHGKVVSYDYDNMGQVVGMTDPDGGQTVYTYTLRSELESVAGPEGAVSFTYDAAGRLERQDNANGTYTLYSYDTAGRPETINHYKGDGTVIDAKEYGYDPAGNTTSVTDGGGAATFLYDPLERLTEASYPGGPTITYSYDAAGNRLREENSVTSTTTYNYGPSSELLQKHTPAGTVNFTYDERGNLATRQDAGGTTIYDFDTDNRLRSILYPGGSEQQYLYYPGQQHLRLAQINPGGDIQRFFYDGANPLVVTNGAGVTLTRYTAGFIMDQWLSMSQGGTSYTFHQDAPGSVTALSDAAGEMAATYAYDPFGNVLNSSGSVASPLGFGGRPYDPLSGLYDYRARQYDPADGRFLSREPVPGSRFFPQTLQPYAYVFNNPLRYIDPTGEFAGTIKDTITWAWGIKKTSDENDQQIDRINEYYRWGMHRAKNMNDRLQVRLRTYEMIRRYRRWKVKKMAEEAGKGIDLQRKVVTSLFPVPDNAPDIVKYAIEKSQKKIDKQFDKWLKPDPSAKTTGDSGKHASGGSGGTGSDEAGTNAAANAADDLGRPPIGPGNDHSDDTYSAASEQFPAAGFSGLAGVELPLPAAPAAPAGTSTGVGAPAYRSAPRVALLWHGFAEQAAAFLKAIGEPYDILTPDFAPSQAAFYPMLLIPSGGLYGLDNAPSFQARLQAYADAGGVILVSAQQHGYEFGALPGGLTGYGWSEDQSCFAAAVSLPLFHQALSGFDVAGLDLLVDGYFTGYPDDATILLERNKNGYPAALLYPVGDGYVMATTAYADWGSSNYQHTRDDHRLWRDLIAWATLGSLNSYDHTLPEFGPGEAATVEVTIDNASGIEAQTIRLILLDPDKQIVDQEEISQPVAGGSATTLNHNLTTGSALGIWTLDYVLLDENGNAVQAQASGAAFAVSDPAEAVGPDRPFDFWITAPTELWQRGASGEFTFNVRNRTTGPISDAWVNYLFHHHYYEKGSLSIYRNSLNLGAIAAGEVVTRAVTVPIETPDRLFGDLYRPGSPYDTHQDRTSFQIRIKPMAVTVTATPDQSAYRPGEQVTIQTILRNEEESHLNAAGKITVRDQKGQIVYQDNFDESLQAAGEANFSDNYTLPVDAQVGVHSIQVQITTPGVSGLGRSSYRVLEPALMVAVQKPAIFQAASDNAVTFQVTNVGFHDVTAETFNMELLDPDGATIWSDSESISAPVGATAVVNRLIPFSEKFGTYNLNYGVSGIVGGSHEIPLTAGITIAMDQTEYSAGSEMEVALKVANSGRFAEDLTLNLSLPAAGYDQSDPLSLDPGDSLTKTHHISLPAGLASASYPLTATISLTSGDTLVKGDVFVVPPAKIVVGEPQGNINSDDPVVISLQNTGGAGTAVNYDLRLQDRTGQILDTAAGLAPAVVVGSAEIITLTLPVGALSGTYYVRGDVDTLATGEAQRLTMPFQVSGAEAELASLMEQPVYISGDLLRAETTITSTGSIVSGADLQLSVSQPTGGDEQWIVHQRGDHSPLYDYMDSTTIDPLGRIWFGTIFGLSVLDTGGTLFDKSDDRWQHFTTDDGLPHDNIYDIAFDANGYAWLATAGGPAVLDINGTLFVKSDDRWQSYFAGSVRSIAVEGSNHVWFGYDYSYSTTFGVRVVDHKGTPFDTSGDTWAYFGTSDGLPYTGAYAISIDDNGRKWIASTDRVSVGNLAVLDDGGTPTNKTDDTWQTFSTADGLLGVGIYDVEIDSAGIKWIATSSGGLNALDDDGTPFDKTGDVWQSFTMADGLTYPRVRDILIDDAGYIWCWVGSTAGVDVLEHNGTPFDKGDDNWTAFTMADGLGAETSGGYLALDSSGAVWIGHETGVLRGERSVTLIDIQGTVSDKNDDNVLNFSRYDGLAHNEFSAIAVDGLNRKWFAYINEDKAGVSILDESGTPFDKEDDRWFYIPSSGCLNCAGLNNDTIPAMAADATDYLWFGNGELNVLDHGGTPGDTSDDLWQVYTSADGHGYLNSSANTIYFDAAGYLWYAGGTGIQVFDHGGTPFTKGDDRWNRFTTSDGLAGTTRNIALDSQERKWAATYNGLSHLDDGGTPFDKGDDQWLTYVKEDGWGGTTDSLLTVMADSYDYIWTSNGLNVGVLDHNGTPLNKSDDTWQIFTAADGLPSNTYILAITEGDDGRIWFGSDDKGVAVLDHGGTPFDKGDDTWQSWAEPERTDGIVLDKLGHRWFGFSSNGNGSGASMLGQVAGQALWQSSRNVDLPASLSFLDTVNIGSASGKLYLEAELTSPGGSVMAQDVNPFYVFPSTTALTMAADAPAYRPGEAITLSGEVQNSGASPITDQTLVVSQDGSVIYTEGPFTVPAGGTHPFTIVTSAPASPGATRFEATVATITIEDELPVIAPQVSAALEGPDLWGSEPLTLTLTFSNSAAIDGQLTVDINGDSQALTVLAGENLFHHQTFQITEDTTYTVTISGDLEQGMTHPVTFGEDLTSLFSPSDLYCAGPLAIPYTLTNTGQLPLNFTTAVNLTGPSPETATLNNSLLPGGVEENELPLDLPAGNYELAWSTPYDGGLETFTVASPDLAALQLESDAVIDGASVLTTTVDNQGCTVFSGTLTVEATASNGIFFNDEGTLSLSPGANASQPFTVTMGAAVPGPYTATVSLRDGSGAIWSQASITGTVPGPELALTTLPLTTLLPAGETVTMTFEVSNFGEAGDEIQLSFQLGDLEDDRQVIWLDAGQTTHLDFTFFVPKDMPSGEVVAEYGLSGELSGQVTAGSLPLQVAGISLAVTAGSDQAAYLEGEPARIDLAITNDGLIDSGDLVALTSFNGITQTQVFSLTSGASTTLPFTYTATFRGDRKVFYGIYGIFEDRGAYLNTLYLHQAQASATLLLDKEVAQPGETVQATLVTTLTTGILNAFVFDESFTLDLGVDTGFSFSIPAGASRGSHAVHYVLHDTGTEWDGREQATWFDVDAPNVRVLEAKLSRNGDIVTTALTVASDRELDGTARGWLLYPDRSAGGTPDQPSGPMAEVPIHLNATLDNQVTLVTTLDQGQMGLHWFMYELIDGNDMVLAGSGEAFDVGLASLDHLTTDQEAYQGESDPVNVSLEIFSSQAAAATIVLELDDGPTTTAPLSLASGYQTLNIPLNGPIPGGTRIVTGTLTVAGKDSSQLDDFAYGTGLPDLMPGAPSLSDELISVVVTNLGGSQAGPSAVRFSRDGGILIGTAQAPALPISATSVISVPWPALGAGGEHTLSVEVDANAQVVEYDEGNNQSQAEVDVARLDVQSQSDKASYTLGETVTISATLTNFVPAGWTATLTTTIYGPSGSIVFEDDRPLLLPPGDSQEGIPWSSAGHPEGSYAVRQELVDSQGEVQSDTALFAIAMNAPTAGFISNTPVKVGDTAYFTNTTSGPGTLTYEWNFGDGSPISTAAEPSHEYTKVGSYTVVLTATNEVGADVFSELFVVEEGQEFIFLPAIFTSGTAGKQSESIEISRQWLTLPALAKATGPIPGYVFQRQTEVWPARWPG